MPAGPLSDTPLTRAAPPAPLTRAVVATDFSQGAAWAVARAAILPMAPGAVLHLLHVHPAAVRASAAAALRRALDDTGLAALQARRTLGLPPLEVAIALRAGDAAEQTARLAWDVEAGLVILGRHRRRLVHDLFLGTTVDHIVRRCRVPVLLVNRSPAGTYRRAIAAVDLSPASLRAITEARRVADRRTSSVELVQAIPEGADAVRAEAELAALAETGEEGPRLHAVVRRGEPREVICDRARRVGADLLAVGVEVRPGLRRAVLGRIALEAARRAGPDLLLARG